MARAISAIKSRPQSSGAVAVSTKPVSGTLMEGQMYVFMGEYLYFASVFRVDMHTPDQANFSMVVIMYITNTSNWFKSKHTTP